VTALFIYNKAIFIKSVFNIAAFYDVAPKPLFSQMAQLCGNRCLWVAGLRFNLRQGSPNTILHQIKNLFDLCAKTLIITFGFIIRTIKSHISQKWQVFSSIRFFHFKPSPSLFLALSHSRYSGTYPSQCRNPSHASKASLVPESGT